MHEVLPPQLHGFKKGPFDSVNYACKNKKIINVSVVNKEDGLTESLKRSQQQGINKICCRKIVIGLYTIQGHLVCSLSCFGSLT
jgi:hypothetical protein